MKEIKTVGEAWRILKEHGLESKYCPHCDQFAQARVLLKQDEKISDLYEACKLVSKRLRCRARLTRNEEDALTLIDEALAKAEGK